MLLPKGALVALVLREDLTVQTILDRCGFGDSYFYGLNGGKGIISIKKLKEILSKGFEMDEDRIDSTIERFRKMRREEEKSVAGEMLASSELSKLLKERLDFTAQDVKKFKEGLYLISTLL